MTTWYLIGIGFIIGAIVFFFVGAVYGYNKGAQDERDRYTDWVKGELEKQDAATPEAERQWAARQGGA